MKFISKMVNLLVGMAIPLQLGAQERSYKLVVIPTFGGPAAIGQLDGPGISQFINISRRCCGWSRYNAIPNFIPPMLTSAERRMHRPQYQRWSLEWEQGMGIRTSVRVGYFGHHGIHELVGNPNANAYGFASLPAGQCGSPPVPRCSDPRFGGVTEWQRGQSPTTTGWWPRSGIRSVAGAAGLCK